VIVLVTLNIALTIFMVSSTIVIGYICAVGLSMIRHGRASSLIIKASPVVAIRESFVAEQYAL